MSETTTPLKVRLRSDLTTAMKSRDRVRADTIRMVLTAIAQAEVAGDRAVELSEQQVLEVLVLEAKKRREAEDAYMAASRPELADKERAEAAVLGDYLPRQLNAEELDLFITQAIEQTGAAALGIKGMGKVMGVLSPQTRGRADGALLAAEVRRRLTAG